jgi:hypothetical protein
MDKGGFEPALRTTIPRFNGFLFKDQEALPLTEAQLDLLILAAESNWAEVEPAIFGTLLERALQPRERHKLGAHYTPRAYVERLVLPTIIEPLREEWEAARTASAILEAQGDEAAALKEINTFHRRLCLVKVLDPACGSGNFLYVTLEHLKRLEGEVTEYMARFPGQLGMDMTGGYTVTPEQLLGLEVNPRAAAIADVVLWIGYLQWHFKTHGNAKRLADPILRQYGNIRQQDAVLSFSEKKPRLDSEGKPITRWDGHSTKPHPVTGLEVPDETAQNILYDFVDPKPATWPEADFIVGNPPFVGNKKMRIALGDGYTEALRIAYKGEVPDSADFVMYWWFKAGEIVRNNKAEKLGFITTNSITQPFNRIIIQNALKNDPHLELEYAIPDHPWVDTGEGAAVRIALTVASKKASNPSVSKVITEFELDNGSMEVELIHVMGEIHPDLSVGIDLTSALALKSNERLAYWGVKLYGKGFILSGKQLELLEATTSAKIIKPFISGRDLAQTPRYLKVIDCDDFEEKEIRENYPDAYQHLLINVKPERDNNPREKRKQNWWLYGENQPAMREATKDLKRYIATGEVLKHRVFQFYDSAILGEGKVCVFGLEDSYFLGILSSKIHVLWASYTGGRLGAGNDLVYVKTKCFDTFPFPAASEDQRQDIRIIAEHLDSHRKRQQATHPTLTITDMYNVLEKLRKGETLSAKDKTIHEQGLVSILFQLHQELDVAVADAYGWLGNLSEEQILEKLVALNKERAGEEANGQIRWLRPEYQNPQGVQQTNLNIITSKATKAVSDQLEWPKVLADQAQALQRILQQIHQPASALDLNRQFKKPVTKLREEQIGQLLETFNALGVIRKTDEGKYVR